VDLQSKIYIAGHTGLVGSALVRVFKSSGYDNLITASRAELDLMDQRQVSRFFRERRPEVVIVAAGRVGGILANDTEPASFIYDNAVIATNLIHTAYKAKATKLLYLGSSCIYPKAAASPIREDALLSGVLEPTNQWYAIAKILGIKLCQAYRQQYGCDFIAAMPTNLYGPNDRYSETHSHVLPALLDRFHLAKSKRQAQVVCWGTGTPRREFLYADDLADACLTLLRDYSEKDIINIGYGEDLSIRTLAESIQETIGYQGEIVWDRSKPDGTYRKLLDSCKIRALGWRPSTSLEAGLDKTYQDYLERL